ncbi:MAG: hypothetical protein K0R39_4162 [Symbiobacteriaceae bacterium]|jgi:hypothetical protein|nr:hypothetical protein [Symbiobacteriaceae bacterium]
MEITLGKDDGAGGEVGGDAPAGGAPIEGAGGPPHPFGLPIRSEAGPPAGGRPVEGEPEFGFPGASIEAPGLYQGTAPVGGPGTLFNRGGAPITVLGGVFGGGLPIGGPVTQIFRSGAPVPNILYLVTLESSGPIGEFFLPTGGGPIGPMGRPGMGPAPFGRFFTEGGQPIFADRPEPGIGRSIGDPSPGGLQL